MGIAEIMQSRKAVNFMADVGAVPQLAVSIWESMVETQHAASLPLPRTRQLRNCSRNNQSDDFAQVRPAIVCRSARLSNQNGITVNVNGPECSRLDAKFGSIRRMSHHTFASCNRDISRRSSQRKIACPCGNR